MSNSTLLVYFLLPISGLAILLLDPESRIGHFYLLVFAGLLISIPLTLLHELAHALAAHALGFRVFAIHLGLGKVLFSHRIAGINWIIHLIPSSGVTLVSGPEMPRYRLRIFLIHLAGPAFHGLLIAFLLRTMTPASIYSPWYWLLVWTNILLLGFNLLPYKAHVAVGQAGTDGWAMLKAPGLTDKELRERQASFYIQETIIAVEDGNLKKALESAEKGLALFPQDPNVRNTLGYVYVHLNDYQRARQIFTQTLSTSQGLPFATKALLMNNVAYANLALDDPALLPEADIFSEQASQTMSWEPAILGTRGGVLVALDRVDEGLELLKSALQKNPDKSGKAIDACLLAWGEWKRGNQQKSDSYLALARDLDPNSYLLKQILKKIQPVILDQSE